MAEALLIHADRAPRNLGADVPLDQIVTAVERSGVSTVALSFSACYPVGRSGTILKNSPIAFGGTLASGLAAKA